MHLLDFQLKVELGLWQVVGLLLQLYSWLFLK